MFFDLPGEINERLVQLGTDHTVMYLVKGDRHMLIGGGGAMDCPDAGGTD